MNYRLFVFICLFFLLLSSCKSPDETPKDILRTAFNSIKKNDWEKFKTFVITDADFLVKEMNHKIKPSQRKNSYAYGVLKPDLINKMKKSFVRAVSGGNDQINFSKSKFKDGIFIENSFKPNLEGGLYSIKINSSENSIDPKDIYPKFIIYKWLDYWRIYKIMFKEDFDLHGTPVKIPRKF